jgi:phosphatase NudJ
MNTEQFKPNTTVAVIIRCKDEFLLVEEIDGGQAVLNQPAGHIEAGESLLAAAQRETLEETGLTIVPQYLSGIYYFYSDSLKTHYMRFCFVCDLDSKPVSRPQDPDIIASHWLKRENLYQLTDKMRSPLVLQCFDDYFAGQRIELTAIKSNL